MVTYITAQYRHIVEYKQFIHSHYVEVQFFPLIHYSITSMVAFFVTQPSQNDLEQNCLVCCYAAV